MSPEIATLRGQLTLTIGDTPAVNLGYIDIPISTTTECNGRGELVLKATPNMREVRELIEQVFIACHALECWTGYRLQAREVTPWMLACPHCGAGHPVPASSTLTGKPTYMCASCWRVSLREEWSRLRGRADAIEAALRAGS